MVPHTRAAVFGARVGKPATECTFLTSPTVVYERPLFFHVVPVPARDFHHDLTGLQNPALASKSRMQLQIGRFVEFVSFFVLHRAQELFALSHDDVARCAGAMSATSVVESDAEVQGDIEDGRRLPVFLVPESGEVELDRAVFGKKSDSDSLG